MKEGILNALVLGVGNIGIRHANLLKEHSKVTLLGIIDPNKDKRESVGADLNVSTFPHLENALAAHKDVDIIHICTPNGNHLTDALAALKNGVNVVIEKPVALSCAEGKLLSLAALKSGLMVIPVLQNRLSPVAQYIQKVTKEGGVGKILYASVDCFWNRNESYYNQSAWRGTKSLDGGALYTQFSHFVDLLCLCLGNVKFTSGSYGNYKYVGTSAVDDCGQFGYTFDGGMGTFNYSIAVSGTNLESRITLIGTEGTLQAGGQYLDKLLLYSGKDLGIAMPEKVALPNVYQGYQGSAGYHKEFIDLVVKKVEGEKVDLPTLDEALLSISLIEDVYSKSIHLTK